MQAKQATISADKGDPEVRRDLGSDDCHKFVESTVSDSSQADYRGAMLT